jgi:hypothetical protein
MKTIALTLFAAALGIAQSQSSTAPAVRPTPKDMAKAATAAQKSSAQNKKPAQPTAARKAVAQGPAQAIPAGAKLVEPNLYRYTDPSGKTWNYRQTPFGISKWEETPASATQPSPAPEPKNQPVAITDLGDSYRFERKTPFGAATWVRKKSELTDEEQVLVGGERTSADDKPTGNQ